MGQFRKFMTIQPIFDATAEQTAMVVLVNGHQTSFSS